METFQNENSPNESKAWFSDLSWKNLLISALVGSVFGGGGAGIVGHRGECLTQDQADVRYITISEADKRAAKRDQQTDRIEIKIDELMKRLDEKYVRKDIYEQNNETVKTMLNRVLENQKGK